jgi:predicted phosphodiesterase
MRARILFVSDLHKRDVDFSTIAGFTKAIDAVQHDLLRFIKENGVTHLVSLGDWYDKGYRSINRSNNDRNFDEELSRAVGGNFYICLGNHFFLERDSNPEMYLIQPSEYYKPTQAIYAVAPVIRAVPALHIGPVQISFFHYSKEDKSYTREREPEATYHIGIYHDDVVVPTIQRNGAGFPGTTMTSCLDSTFANIDLAIVGHIHKPIGVFNVQSFGRKLTMIVPGSLAITETGNKAIHTDVDLPVVEISDEGKVSCALATFSLHTNLLRFYKKKDKPIRADMPGQAILEIPKTVSLSEYLRARGFDNFHLRLVEAAAESDVDVIRGLQLLGIVGE